MKQFRDSLAAENGFVLAIVAESDFNQNCLCPHCNSELPPHRLEGIMDLPSHLGELLLCDECLQAFVTVAYPTLMHDESPVFLNVVLRKEEESPLIKALINERVGDMIATIMTINI
jgi:hypothetical protein